jgi:hypothetical protein
MALPTSNISMIGIYSEANGGTGPDINAGNLFKLSYFEGPPFGSTITYSAWGQYGNTSGANRIYGLTAGNADNSLGDFLGRTYYYDNSTYTALVNIDNTRQGPPYPPFPPGSDNTVTTEIFVYDSTGTYEYITSGAIAVPPQNSTSVTISNPAGTVPIIAMAYWRVRFTALQSFPGGGASVFVDINGTNYVFNGNVPDFSSVNFRWDDVGATAAPIGATGLYFSIRIN